MEKCHFIGIGGIGMSSLARILLNRKIKVSGTDIAASSLIDSLIKEGAAVQIGHSAKYITPDMSVIYTSDIKADNPELAAAKSLNCQLLHRSQLLQTLMESSRSLAIAGTHGKTTTAALLAWALQTAGLSPSYSIGGIVPQLASHGTEGKGDLFVAEACESDGSFLNYKPYGAIVTNIDLDHMDFYKKEEHLCNAFACFLANVASPSLTFWCGEDRRLQEIRPKGIVMVFDPSFPLYISQMQQKGWSTQFNLQFQGQQHAKIELALAGEHNILNAAAVFGLCLSLDIDPIAIRTAFKSFNGVQRRCEKKAEKHGILFLDDYAHHPTELKATLKAIRKAVGERRVIAVYQPHRYSRAKSCLQMFEGVFDAADALFVTEIYAAREAPLTDVTHATVFADIEKDTAPPCRFIERAALASEIASLLRPHDVLVTLGAGDVTRCTEEILSTLKKPYKYKVGVIFGGISVEHAVSLMSAEFILSAFNPEYYEIEHFGISRKGNWVTGPHAAENLKSIDKNAAEKMPAEIFQRLMACDILFPVLHGTYGEDGTIQGLFELFSKPYVGPDYRSAALAMDKALTKRLAADQGIPVLPFITFSCYDWEENEKKIVAEIEQKLRYPLFVKPVHLGSSIGVRKVKNEKELTEAIIAAFKLDLNIIVENGIEGREIEFAVLGNGQVTAFPPGEIFPDSEICSYAGKYHSAGRDPEIIADLSPELVEKGIELVKKAYEAIGCNSMSRIDTFLDENGNYWLNEINPIPGCTKNSPFPKMCMAHGLSKEALIDRLLVLALERRRRLNRLHYDEQV